MDLHNWTLVYPYRNPAAALDLALPSPGRTLRHRPVPWTEQGIPQQDMDWVSTKTSKQYPAFQDTVRRLRARGNRVFVIVGPFNEHLLTEAGVQRYRAWRDAAAGWLASEQVPHVAPNPLPSDEYGDASHPLSAGYHRLADALFANQSSQLWIARK